MNLQKNCCFIPQNNIIEFQGASNILKKIDINGFFGDAKVIFSSNDPAHRSSLTNSISATVIETAGSTIGIDAEEIGLYGRTNINNSPYAKTLFLRKFVNSFIDAIFAATNNLYLIAK